jgi:Polysaccharide deacetylase
MSRVPRGAPYDEQGGRLRGVIDLAAGRYPSFLFGFPVGRILPVFHFHEETRATLEPKLRYLAENGYRTVTSAALAGFVRDRRHPGARTVMLAFDDAWSSLWTIVRPLLEQYDFQAVTYVIPWRLADADVVRPTISQDRDLDARAHDQAPNPFVTWPELKGLSTSGRVDVQSHTWTHSMVFVDDRPYGVVEPDFSAEHPLNRPRVDATGDPAFLDASRLGYPRFASRSRMSDGRRFFPDPSATAALEERVRQSGGPTFFSRHDWSSALRLPRTFPGRWEEFGERDAAIEHELGRSREMLEERLGIRVEHLCLPWGVTGRTTRAALERMGFVTAFANRLPGRLAVAAGDDPYFLKRLHSRHIFALPGRGRKVMVTLT